MDQHHMDQGYVQTQGFQHPVQGFEPVGQYVFGLEDVPDNIYGKHLKDYEAQGNAWMFLPKPWMPCMCTCDRVEIRIKYSFFTEGILESKTHKTNECFNCFTNESYSWVFYPRHLIDHVQVDTENSTKCFGICSFCVKKHTLVDIVTRDEAANPETSFSGNISVLLSGKTKKVSLKMNGDEAHQFFLFCQNYTYNTNFQASRIYNMEFLKTLGESKYAITPTDWVNYYLSHHKGELYGFKKDALAIPHPSFNCNEKPASGGGLFGGGGGGGGGGHSAGGMVGGLAKAAGGLPDLLGGMMG